MKKPITRAFKAPGAAPEKKVTRTIRVAGNLDLTKSLEVLARHASMLEAKLWMTIHYLASKKQVDLDEYARFLEGSQDRIAVAQREFFYRIARDINALQPPAQVVKVTRPIRG